MSRDCHIYIVRDLEREPGEKPVLMGWVHDEPLPRTDGFFAHSHVDPVLGEMIYPVSPDEWDYFALYLTKDEARLITHLGIDNALFMFYLGFPADD